MREDESITHAVSPPSETAIFDYVLEVVRGPDEGKSLTLSLANSQTAYIGKSEACDLCLSDRSVSRRHLWVSARHDGVRVVDKESTNGTFVNQRRIFDVLATDGDFIKVGDSVLSIRTEDRQVAKKTDKARASFGGLVGTSTSMRKLYARAEQAAGTSVPILIEGETGTGKEVLAEALHEASPRAGGPFEVFDCTTVSPNLLESTLFGHEKGAFTGAMNSRPGVFERAHKGTLLIDELGDLDIQLQAKLLRAVERLEVQRVGGAQWHKVDVRVICATRRDLEKEIQAGRFRDDLFYRLAVARLELPPLRERVGDIDLLASFFWERLSGGGVPLPSDFLERWAHYRWPGNVRELSNAVARRFALGAEESGVSIGRELVSEDVESLDELVTSNLAYPVARRKALELFNRRFVEVALERHGGNVSHAAAASGIARRYFALIRSKKVGG
jgi:two-component system, NtrC family, response regulator HydG